jgi:hypothetical protein
MLSPSAALPQGLDSGPRALFSCHDLAIESATVLPLSWRIRAGLSAQSPFNSRKTSALELS